MGKLETMKLDTGNTGCIHFTNLQRTSSPSMKEDILAGLLRRHKAISTKYLYDRRGSFLFDLICDLPEYYLTRTEISILKRYGDEIMKTSDGRICLIEPGAGSCQKSRLLLDAGVVSAFVPVDICSEFLWQSTVAMADSYPHVRHYAIAMDFLEGMGRISHLLPAQDRRLLFFAGSSIGNFDPTEACRLLSQFAQLLRGGDGVLIGYDLQKDTGLLERAYNDSKGITAAFNLNLLARLNRELHADFDLGAFEHAAFYNPFHGRIEMHLRSAIRQEVTIGDSRLFFEKGETIHTESSYKYTVDGFDALAGAAGLDRAALWTDPDRLFAVALYAPRL